MINFSTNSNAFNPLVNLKVSVKNADSKGTNSSILNSSQNTNSTQNKNSNSNEILGYKVDKDGFFTAEFNEKAGIPKDFKIHSISMQQIVEQAMSYQPFNTPLHASIDIAASVGNAYKVFSQLTNDSTKSTFHTDEIQNLPFIYQYNTSTLELANTLSRSKSSNANIENLLAQDKQSEFLQTKNLFLEGFFDSEIGLIRNSNEMQKYTNQNGKINAGGLLVAVLNANDLLIESETTIWGKMLGADRHTNANALNKWFHQSELQNIVVFGEKDFMQMLKGTDLNEFKMQYKAYQNKKIQENSSQSIGLDDAVKEAQRYLELLFGKSLQRQKGAQNTNFMNESAKERLKKVDIKA